VNFAEFVIFVDFVVVAKKLVFWLLFVGFVVVEYLHHPGPTLLAHVDHCHYQKRHRHHSWWILVWNCDGESLF
jgi:hypothetical protein